MFSTTQVAADVLKLLPRKRLSSAVGNLADLRHPRGAVGAAIRAFCRIYDVDLDEAEIPAGGFDSFNRFFTRSLRPGSRAVDDRPGVVVSPADGRVEDLGPIEADASFLVKGQRYSCAELLCDESRARAFEGGHFFIVYLSPRDYHRVHAPVAGPVSDLRHVGGTLYPVNSIGLQHVPLLFAQNERVVTYQQTDDLGSVATVMVGAIGVGRITLSYEPRVTTNMGSGVDRAIHYADGEAPQLGRGAELGKFHLGSTAIVLVPPQRFPMVFAVEPGVHVQMGRAVLRGGAE